MEQDAFEKVALELFQQLLRIDTSNTGAPDSGNEKAAISVLTQAFDAYPSIQYEIIDDVEYQGRGNLVARILRQGATEPEKVFSTL